MRDTYAALITWIYFIVATLTEVAASENSARLGSLTANSMIAVLAVSQGVMMAWVFMHLRHESTSLRLLALAPILILVAMMTGILVSVIH
ncbi:MAG: cytochrome C oxidase subunit IV family protein [Thermoprotei archaeon]